MPHAPFLLPGIGAQGGAVADLAPAFAPGRAGGLVSASRSIANAHEAGRRRARRRRARRGRAAARGGLGARLSAAPGGSAGPRVSSSAMAGRSPARFLAPLALVAFALALFVVVSSTTKDDAERRARRAPPRRRSATPTPEREEEAPRAKTYTIKSGDTPSGIAEKVGVPLDQILELNPELDPQTLTPGHEDQAALMRDPARPSIARARGAARRAARAAPPRRARRRAARARAPRRRS